MEELKNEPRRSDLSGCRVWVAGVIGYDCGLRCLKEKRDETSRKLADTTKLSNLGCQPGISLRALLRTAYQWYSEQVDPGGDATIGNSRGGSSQHG